MITTNVVSNKLWNVLNYGNMSSKASLRKLNFQKIVTEDDIKL